MKISQTLHLKAHSEKFMMLNYSMEKTPKVSKVWLNQNQERRINSILMIIEKNQEFNCIKVVECHDNGNVDIDLDPSIRVGKRGLYILNFEELIKKEIDHGLTVWCKPLGDKNSLRNLRGIQIK